MRRHDVPDPLHRRRLSSAGPTVAVAVAAVMAVTLGFGGLASAAAQTPPPGGPAPSPAAPGAPREPLAPAGTTLSTNVANMEPHSAESFYLSLPGYLRWVVYLQSGRWVPWVEAQRMVENASTPRAPSR